MRNGLQIGCQLASHPCCSPGGAWDAGEIIPQALCTRYGLQIGAYSAWFVRGLMAVTSPLTFPISKILDWLLGTEHGARPCFPC